MASLDIEFDASEYDTEDQRERNFEELPAGVYRLEVIQSDVEPTKSGKGTALKLRFNVIEPEELAGRLLFASLNIQNDNDTAERIGKQELAKLWRATGHRPDEKPKDSTELHSISFIARVGLGKPSKEKDEFGNPRWPARMEIVHYFYPDSDDIPAIGVDHPTAANDNHPPARQAANDNAPPSVQQQAGGATGKSRPWGKRAA